MSPTESHPRSVSSAECPIRRKCRLIVAALNRACQRYRADWGSEDLPGEATFARSCGKPALPGADCANPPPADDGLALLVALPAGELAEVHTADEGVPLRWGEAKDGTARALAIANTDDVVS